MKKKIFSFILVLILILPTFLLSGCDYSNGTSKDIDNTFEVAEQMANSQPTPKDIDYSLERYNLIRRAYWVNGQREKAMSLPCQITKPLGYIILFSNSGAVIGRFIVDGKVSSLNSWLTPDYYYDYIKGYKNDEKGWNWYFESIEMPDVDGSYGTNVEGIFFFTTDGKYIEWTGDFLYSDIPFTVEDPVLKTE